MLQRVANVIVGAMILTLAGCMLAAHLTSGEPLQVLIVLLGGVLLAGAAACLRAGLVAEVASLGGSLPTTRDAAAWRLRELKRAGASRPLVRLRLPVEAPPHASTRALSRL